MAAIGQEIPIRQRNFRSPCSSTTFAFTNADQNRRECRQVDPWEIPNSPPWATPDWPQALQKEGPNRYGGLVAELSYPDECVPTWKLLCVAGSLQNGAGCRRTEKYSFADRCTKVITFFTAYFVFKLYNSIQFAILNPPTHKGVSVLWRREGRFPEKLSSLS